MQVRRSLKWGWVFMEYELILSLKWKNQTKGDMILVILIINAHGNSMQQRCSYLHFGWSYALKHTSNLNIMHRHHW